MREQEMDNLKDLGEIVEAISKKITDFKTDDIRLSNNFKVAYIKNSRKSGISVEFNETTAVITNTQGQKIYAPNQWFLLAANAVDLVIEINKYKTYTEKVVSELLETNSDSSKQKIYDSLRKDNDDENVKEKFKTLMQKHFENEGMEENAAKKNTDLLFKFVSDYNWWSGGKSIDRADFDISPILSVLNLVNASQGYVATITKAYLDDKELRKQLSTIIYSESEENLDNNFNGNNSQVFQNRTCKVSTCFERNRIIFGAPGTGKSHKLKEDSKKLLNNSMGTFERVTFYPDYSYSQFVGTYKPVMDGKDLSYEFVAGPFLRVYVEAIKNKECPHLLLIEEINRAKVAAVFGDVFQLLDRNDDGFSQYEIQTSEDIRKYLAKEFNDIPDNWSKIKLPDNMFIWATMNSADQGVFPMDAAFKRRWDFEYFGIDENESYISGKSITLGSNDDELLIEWNKLRKAINEKLAKDYRVNEDKLIGPFFLSKSVIETISDTDKTIIDREKFIKTFKSKVIMYLYEDAAKQHKHKLFSGCDSSRYSSVCDAFDKIGIRIFGDDFKETYDQQEG